MIQTFSPARVQIALEPKLRTAHTKAIILTSFRWWACILHLVSCWQIHYLDKILMFGCSSHREAFAKENFSQKVFEKTRTEHQHGEGHYYCAEQILSKAKQPGQRELELVRWRKTKSRIGIGLARIHAFTVGPKESTWVQVESEGFTETLAVWILKINVCGSAIYV